MIINIREPSVHRRHVELIDASRDKENARAGMNHRVDDLNASAKRQWVLRFGGDKAANDMSVGHIKAIYGKQVKEGKLTIEDKANVKVLIQALPAECARLMKTLTTLKGQPPAQQKVFLASLGCCVKCEAKVAERRAKHEEKQRKLIAAQLEQAEHELAKKRKREQAESDREAAKAAKLSAQLERVERVKAEKETMEKAVEAKRQKIEEEKRNAAALVETLREEKEAVAEARRALKEEKKALDAEQKEVDAARARIESERRRCERDQEKLNAQLDAAKATAASLETARKAVEKESASLEKERERRETEAIKLEEQVKATEAKRAAWNEARKFKEEEAAWKAEKQAAAEHRRREAAAKREEAARRKAEREAATAAKMEEKRRKMEEWRAEYERWQRTGEAGTSPPPRPDQSSSPSGFYGTGGAPKTKSQPPKQKKKPILDDDDDDDDDADDNRANDDDDLTSNDNTNTDTNTNTKQPDFDAAADQLHQILVGRYDCHVGALFAGLAGVCRDKVVGLEAFHLHCRYVECLDQFVDDRELGNKIVWWRWTLRLVFRINIAPEGFARCVENDRDMVRVGIVK